MKKTLYIFFTFIFVMSCTSRTIYKKPKNLIEREKMITVWTDIYLATGAKSVKTKLLEKNKNYVPLVLEKYSIDSIQFSVSNLYYTSKIDEYEKMFEEVRTRLKALKDVHDPKTELDSLIKGSNEPYKRKKSLDSIKKNLIKKDSTFSLNKQNRLKKVK